MREPVLVPEGCRLVTLPQILDARGTLTALEELVQVPFRIGTVRWFYDTYDGASWRETETDFGDALVVALSGNFDVLVGGRAPGRVHLSRASIGLHLPARTGWKVDSPSTNSVGLLISPQGHRGSQAGLNQQSHDPAAAPGHDSTIDDCRTMTFTHRRQGHESTTEVVAGVDVPFGIPRVYYLYDIPGGASRGGHAHRELNQVLVAVAGSFDVNLSDGRRDLSIRLDRGHSGLHIAPWIWRGLRNFSSGAVCLTLASAPFDEADYIRGYNEFLQEKRRNEGRGRLSTSRSGSE